MSWPKQGLYTRDGQVGVVTWPSRPITIEYWGVLLQPAVSPVPTRTRVL